MGSILEDLNEDSEEEVYGLSSKVSPDNSIRILSIAYKRAKKLARKARRSRKSIKIRSLGSL